MLVNRFTILIGLFAIVSCQTETKTEEETEMSKNVTEPDAIQDRHVMWEHGNKRVDDYFWMNQRDTKEVLNYLDEENAYRKAMMANTVGLQDSLYSEMVSREKESYTTAPYFDNGYYYYSKYEEGKDYEVICRRKGSMEAHEETVLDVNELAEGEDFYDLGGWDVSPNNNYVAYGFDNVSRRQYKIKIKDLNTGKMLEDEINNTDGHPIWADNSYLFFVTKDPQTLREDRVWRHKIYTDATQDSAVFHEIDETYSVSIGRSKTRAFILIESHSTMATEHRFLSTANPTGDFSVFASRKRGVEYDIYHDRDRWLILTNLDAQNFRVMSCPQEKTSTENWQEVIPHRENVRVEGVEVFADYFVVTERENGLRRFMIRNKATGNVKELDIPEETAVIYSGYNFEYDTTIFRYDYTSLTTPPTEFDYDLSTGEQEKVWQKEIPGYDGAKYESKRIWATARDGKRVAISMVYRKSLDLSKPNPVLQYGYGSYGYTINPSFKQARVSLLDRGFIFCIAHIRGGQYLGREWYEDGKLLKKKNTFYDFIDCSKHLIDEGYTTSNQLFAMGGSAGGLLMGAVANMAPELYKGIVASVPFVDVVTTMLDESIPLTTSEYDEWGNPNDSIFYEYMLSYSPYDNVVAQDYPNILVTTGYHDSQVQYWEPAKWVAKLRDLKTDKNQLLFYCNMETGHGGASGRYQQFKETAMEYAFIITHSR